MRERDYVIRLITIHSSVTSGTVVPNCTDNSLRLANQMTSTSSDGLVTIEGHVEICLSGTYYAICDEGWDDRDAQVACRALTNNIGTYSMFQHYNILICHLATY